MRYYESLYIVNPNYEQGKLDEVMKTVSEAIADFGFNPINHFVWGKKRLAYNIQEHKYGSYVMLHFETESPENLESFERFMVLQKPILRNQTVVLDEKPKKQSEKVSSSEGDRKALVKDSVEKMDKSLTENKPKETEEETPAVEETEEETPAVEETEENTEEETPAVEETEEELEENKENE
jgi:small subunit ribosomal protein S6